MDKTNGFGRVSKWVPAFIVMAVISALSLTSGTVIHSLGLGNQVYQINGHFFLFILLGATYFKATKNVFHSIMLTLIFGIIDELHQTFTPYRSSSVFDILVDASGGLISGVIIWRFSHILPKRLKNWLLK